MDPGRLIFIVGNRCEEKSAILKTTLFVHMENENKEYWDRIHQISFIVDDEFVEMKTLPPFVSQLQSSSPVGVKFMIYLEDGNTHVFTHQVVIALGTHSRSVECSLDLFAEKKQPIPMPLSDRAYHIELDLQVPYPQSRSSFYHPKKIAKYLESRSHMRCVFTGYYTEELRPEGGNQVPSCNFSGKGMVFRPYEEDAAASRTHSPNRRLSDVKPDTSNHTSMKKVKLFNGMPWKLAFDPSTKVNISGSGQATNLILVSPVVRGHAGLEMIYSMLLSIAAASTEYRLMHRPGFRVGVSLLDLQFSQIVKITQQYFKFEDVIESMTCDPVEARESWESPRTEDADSETVHKNGADIKTRAKETTIYRENVVEEVCRKQVVMHKLLGGCAALEDLIQAACPHQSRLYRFSLRKVRTRGYLEFRMQKQRTKMRFLSCFIQLVVRLVENAASAPAPKLFRKNGPGKSFSYREEKFFSWVIRDRYLRDELQQMRKNRFQENTVEDLVVESLQKLGEIPRGISRAQSRSFAPADVRVNSRRLGLAASTAPTEISMLSLDESSVSDSENREQQWLDPSSPRDAMSSNAKNSFEGRAGRMRMQKVGFAR